DGAVEPPFAELGEFHDLRFLGTVLPPDEANLAAHARALVIWHNSQMFCGVCGSSARPEAGGNYRVCMNDECRQQLFPRVDPAIIVLVSAGDRCLLGRQTSWPEGRYSTIAGFVEPGESLEDAVRREVYEETNVHVDDVRYHSSQPWPFPSSLMLGFIASATSGEIALNDGELEDAQWFTRKELRSGFPKLPFRVSIARRLVDDWIENDGV
ncbi:MAG: NAD(+) diphosphatase, partial [Woeseiaceae bacterium]